MSKVYPLDKQTIDLLGRKQDLNMAPRHAEWNPAHG